MIKKGITLVELLIVIGIITLLFGLSEVSLSNLEREDALSTIVSDVKTTIYQAQIQTINGNPTGVYFENSRYIIFFGTSFVDTDPNNQIKTLPTGISLTNINLPSNSITFAKITGEIVNFSSPENFTLLEQSTGKTRQFILNKLGVIEVQ